MKSWFAVLAALLPIFFSFSGCQSSPADLSPQEQDAFYADLDVYLGDLCSELSPEDYNTAAKKYLPIWEKQQQRLDTGAFMGFWERCQLRQFSYYLDDLTLTYLGYDGSYYPDTEDSEVYFVDYEVNAGQLGEGTFYDEWFDSSYTEADFHALWETAQAILPEDALDVFSYYTVFSDGEYGVMAYVAWDVLDDGIQWSLALDPMDSEDETEFYDTILHEYFHYLSLNEEQVTMNVPYGEGTYETMNYATLPDSYLNQFYQEFWSPRLWEERMLNEDSMDFSTRHYWDFYNDYASTTPTEDIAECFALYVLWDDGWYDDTDLKPWEQKIAWFDQFPELRQFRAQVRENLTEIGYL